MCMCEIVCVQSHAFDCVHVVVCIQLCVVVCVSQACPVEAKSCHLSVLLESFWHSPSCLQEES